MKSYTKNFLFAFGIILFGALMYHFYFWCGPKIYDVLSTTNEGEKAIKEYNIKYISPEVYGIGVAEYYRKDGFFVVDVEEQGNSIKYSTLKQDNVDKLGLKPKFTFEEKYWALIGFFLFLLFVIIAIFEYKKKSDDHDPPDDLPDLPKNHNKRLIEQRDDIDITHGVVPLTFNLE